MPLEFTRVLFGLTLALFHAQVADYLRKQDLALSTAFRERGIPIPDALPKQAADNLFFFLGVSVALFSLVRIWMTIR